MATGPLQGGAGPQLPSCAGPGPARHSADPSTEGTPMGDRKSKDVREAGHVGSDTPPHSPHPSKAAPRSKRQELLPEDQWPEAPGSWASTPQASVSSIPVA